jgi:enoyl-CoA hydratase
MSDLILVERPAPHVALCTINRPKALNALNPAVVDALGEALAALEAEGDVRCAVLRGAGEKAFVAGADIGSMVDYTPLQAEYFAGRGQRVLAGIAGLAFPVIAAVHGFALGGGCELAMACDLILAGPRAKFGQPEVNLGVIPGFGGSQRLTRRVGLSNSLDLCLSGRIIGAEEAVRMGLASQLVDGDVFEAALELAGQIARKGPVAIRLCKRAIHENADADLTSAMAAERTLFGLCFASADQGEGMAAFLEKRKAEFTGT